MCCIISLDGQDLPFPWRHLSRGTKSDLTHSFHPVIKKNIRRIRQLTSHLYLNQLNTLSSTTITRQHLSRRPKRDVTKSYPSGPDKPILNEPAAFNGRVDNWLTDQDETNWLSWTRTAAHVVMSPSGTNCFIISLTHRPKTS
jgi:hypothetical protein